MLKNYFNVALRNLFKHKFYSLLNVIGLSIGLACFMLISLFVKDEMSYDAHFDDAERIYRVDFAATLNGADHISAAIGAPTALALRTDYPEVEDAVLIRNSGNWFVKRKGQTETFKEEHVAMADSNFFKFFSLELIYGDPKTALNRPNTLVLDRTTAIKIFGDMNPVGEVLVLDNRTDYEVTGVYEDIPDNTHFHHDMMLSMSTFEWTNNQNWLSTNFNTYLKMKEGNFGEALEAKFPDMVQTYCAPLIGQFLNMNMEEFRNSGNAVGFSLFPLTDIHLTSNKESDLEANGDIKYVYIFSAVGLFILILACINFMNLATARSANRAKEVGVRKSMGARKNQLINQFISEALLISILAFFIACLISFLTIPSFNALAVKELSFSNLLDTSFVLFMLGVMVLVGLLAGSYPAFYMSMFKPAEALKGTVRTSLRPSTYIISRVIAIAIAWATISFQSWKAARVNPAQSLKDE